ncbi:MAG: hypothetical protein KDD19_12015 [Phaeodactylibacter sp.]|nr:hypothetical protein [Phaeodactylibacter sp.]MCB9049938.1 hypothetical protein [Lewinellaceae bacterium]
MNQLKWTTLVGALLLATFGDLAAQSTFSKQWIYEQGRAVLARKVKATPEELQALRQQLPQPAEPPTGVSFRNLENNVSGSEKPESEVHAAVNPRDTNNIIIAGMVLDADAFLGTLSFPIYYTKDFGNSWELSQFDGVSDLGAFTLILGGGDPVLAFDTDGTAYLSWLTFTINIDFTIGIQLHWAISTDGGESWQRQESYIDSGEVASLDSPDSRFVDKEWLATDLSPSPYRNNLYAAYVEINLADTTYNILVKTKAADSDDFGEAVDVTPEEIVFSQFSSIDVDREGNVHVLFAGATAQDIAMGIYHCVSEDGGATFSAPVRISSFHLPCFPPGAGGDCDLVGIDSSRVYPCPHLRVDKSGGEFNGNLYAVWTSDGFETELTSGVDIYYSYSKDGGLNWADPLVLNNDGIAASEQFFPSLSVNDKGILAVSWYDRREDPNNLMTKYYMTYSKDGGLTFEEDHPVSTEGSDFSMIGAANANFGIGEYTQILTTSGYAIPVWADGRTNDGNIDLYVAFLPLGENTTTDIPTINVISDRFTLGQLTPNPAVEQSRVELLLKGGSTVQTQLFGQNGNLVWEKAHGELPEGVHQLNVPVAELPAGQYLLRVITDFGFQSRKLQVQR